MDIFVGNLPYELEESALEAAFGNYGSVNRVKIILDRETGRSRGIAFVTMDDQAEAQSAIENLDGSELGGRPIKVNEARPREDRPPPRGGGFGGGGGGRDYGKPRRDFGGGGGRDYGKPRREGGGDGFGGGGYSEGGGGGGYQGPGRRGPGGGQGVGGGRDRRDRRPY